MSKLIDYLHLCIDYLDHKVMVYKHFQQLVLKIIVSFNENRVNRIKTNKGIRKTMIFILWTGVQAIYAFPVNPYKQLHIATWLITSHIALLPQKFSTQGFSHLFRMHALFLGHSEFKIHSGWQPKYGSPM